jgi:hypothetical protein
MHSYFLRKEPGTEILFSLICYFSTYLCLLKIFEEKTSINFYKFNNFYNLKTNNKAFDKMSNINNVGF